MKSLTLYAPAKINLYLDVINKRRDGYHNIATIFQKINLCDKVTVALTRKGISLYCKYPGVPADRRNLAYKAARLMKNEFSLDSGISIRIIKKIPPAAGLGGGSSDAASVIKAVNKLFNLNLSQRRLNDIARRLGADVPFFVSDYDCAIGTGIGDRLKKINKSRPFYVLLLIPKGLRLYTKTIYSKVSLPLTKQAFGANMLTRILSGSKRATNLRSLLYNRLEDVVFPDYPIVKEAKAELSSYNTAGALLSGSGPSVFALFDRRKEAMRARGRIGKDGRWQLFLTRIS